MNIKKILKNSLISLAVLGMVGGSLNNVNAKRHYHHYRRDRKAKRTIYKYGYYKHHRFHYYKTGYYRNGKWIKRRTRRAHVKPTKKSKSSKQAKYMWTMYGSKPSDYEKVQVIGHDKSSGEPHVQLVSKSKKLAKLNAGRRFYVPTYGLFHTKAAVIKDIKESNKSSRHHHNNKNQKNHSNSKELAKQEIQLINKDRADHDKAPLTESSRLDKIAQMGAKRLANGAKFGHIDKNGDPYSSEDAYKLGYISSPSEDLFGENADAGDDTPRKANNSLYTKEASYDGGHYQNIISEYPNENYTDVGVGVATNPKSEYGTYWVEDFVNRNYDNDFNNNSSNDSSDDNSSNDLSSDDNNDSYTVNNNNNNGSSSTSYSNGSSNNNNNNSNGGSAVAVEGGGVGGSATGGTVYSSNGTVIARGGSAAGGAGGVAAAA